MAVVTKVDNPEKLELEVNNGDLKALNEIIETWDFKDKESALRFAIAVMKITKPGRLFQEENNGTKSALLPTEILMKKDQDNG